MEMNDYQRAIERNEIREFYYGIGSYFDKGERGEHNSAGSFYAMIHYGEMVGEEKMYSLMEKDLIMLLSDNDVSFDQYFILLSFVFYYFNHNFGWKPYRYEWKIPEKLICLLRDNYLRLDKISHENLHDSTILVNDLKRRFNFYILEESPFSNVDTDRCLHEVDEKYEGEYIVPDGITRIGKYAFNNCSKITKIVMPDTVQIVEWFAFWNCSSLQSIKLSDNIGFLGASAFCGCSSLKSIKLPVKLFSLGDEVFEECYQLEEIKVDEQCNKFKVYDGILYSRDMSKLIKCPSKANFKEVRIPSSVKEICTDAFVGV